MKAKNKIIDCPNFRGPLFVIGMPRSGTTVISEAVSVHEDLGWLSNYINWLPELPELAFFSRVLDIPFLGPHLRGKKTQDKRVSSFVRRLFPFTAEAYRVWNRYCVENFSTDFLRKRYATSIEKERAMALVSKILRYQGKKRFFSKMTGPPRIQYLNSIFSNAYYIHVIRDPRANISSLLKVSFWKENDGYTRPWWTNGISPIAMTIWENYDRSPVALSALQWVEVVQTAWKEKETICKKHFIEIRYEDFVRDPVQTLRQISDKVGLQPSPNIQRYIYSLGKIYDMNYKFRENLKGNEIKIIEEITFETANKAGYFIRETDPF